MLIELAFFAVRILKTKLRNKIAIDWFNNVMVFYIEKERFKSINEALVL
jgi:hypothetical protein